MIYIVGAGIAGISLARELGKLGVAWQILEKEPQVGLHASGKNAGIVRTYETDPLLSHFTQLTLAIYRTEEPSFDACGLLIKPWEVDYAMSSAPRRNFSHRRHEGYFLSENGCIEPLSLLQRLLRDCSASGQIRYGFAADFITYAGQITALTNALADSRIELKKSDKIVIASGEGALAHAQRLAQPLGLVAHRRTLYEYANSSGYSGPVEWNEETSCYFRVWGDRLLATAGEQIPYSRAQVLDADAPNQKHLRELQSEYAFLSETNLVGWRSCLRVMPPDNRPYCGQDSTFSNLFWFTGLGGRGVSLAPALAGELAASIAETGSASIWADALKPARAAADS